MTLLTSERSGIILGSSGIVLGDVFIACVRVEHAGCLLEERLSIPDRLIDVVGSPGAVLCIARDRAEQAPNALVHVELEQQRGTGNIQKPLAGRAHIVVVVHDVVAHVAVSCHL